MFRCRGTKTSVAKKGGSRDHECMSWYASGSHCPLYLGLSCVVMRLKLVLFYRYWTSLVLVWLSMPPRSCISPPSNIKLTVSWMRLPFSTPPCHHASLAYSSSPKSKSKKKPERLTTGGYMSDAEVRVKQGVEMDIKGISTGCKESQTYFSCVEKSSLVSSSSHDSSHRCLVVSPPLAASVSSTVQSVS
jgi:hypothetical protein